jgi:hypothetical protein
VFFSKWDVRVTLPRTSEEVLGLGILCRQSDWQLSSLAQVCGSSFPQALIFAVEHLYIQSGLPQSHWQDDIESSQWLELFYPFTDVKNLYISSELIPHITSALQELVGERAIEVLPALQTLFLEVTFPLGPVEEAIGQFVASRQLSNLPIVISRWEKMDK